MGLVVINTGLMSESSRSLDLLKKSILLGRHLKRESVALNNVSPCIVLERMQILLADCLD
jgi:hypothetical protein